ncbi:MAG: hypothetical protein OEY63_06940, partial [Gemmatimonadota bacterium]|nr:hypothetical protein [Gemmatimonadota bacterium]
MSTIRNRLLLIVFLVLWTGWSLRPRDVVVATADDGTDSTETQWGIKLGLDLQGGMHLAVEIDQSGGPVSNPEDALNRAETVIRSRIDEFGVAEPLIQKMGTERIIIELPGVRDRDRAKEIVERSAFLEFRITDMQEQFASALPSIDAALARAGISASVQGSEGAEAGGSALQQLLGSTDDSLSEQGADSVSAQAQTEPSGEVETSGSVFSQFLAGGSMQGQFFVREVDQATVEGLIATPEFQRALPRGIQMFWGDAELTPGSALIPLYALEGRPIITGDQLSDAQAQLDQLYNSAVVNFTLTRAGGRIFARET